MVKNIDIKEVVKHIVNGTLDENLCRVCLQQLDSLSENIFTTVCKDDKEYCIADVLKAICDIKITPSDKFKICSECFIAASSAYNFFLSTRRSEEILNFYVSLLEEQIQLIDVPDHLTTESLCVTLPLYNPETEIFDYDLSGILAENATEINEAEYEDTVNKPIDEHDKNISETEDNSDIVIIADENGEQTFYKELYGSLVPVNEDGKSRFNEVLKKSLPSSKRMKIKRRRNPMSYIMCSKCPVRYKFVAKLKEHMTFEHDIDLFICTVCKTIIENEEEFNKHLKTHANVHRCAKCNLVFKNRESINTHLKWHEEMENVKGTEKAHICEVCGLVLMDEEQLKEHNDKKHVKKYTCYYCGRMYKGQSSFETHIKKHEIHMKGGTMKDVAKMKDGVAEAKKKSMYSCGVCERSFVDERSLVWHQRLHTNERPYVCDVCGRGFVSLNRRNQHAVCAHTAPARRCPLCPALFHLRSMVNTHVKKVHLTAHKRRNRTSKHQNVFWRTEPVPIQELSVSIQNEILELQAAQKGGADGIEW